MNLPLARSGRTEVLRRELSIFVQRAAEVGILTLVPWTRIDIGLHVSTIDRVEERKGGKDRLGRINTQYICIGVCLYMYR